MDILIKDTPALLYDDNGGMRITETNICIRGRTIISVGDIPEGFAPKKTIGGSGFLAIPGLINCHTHSYMSVFRNLADDLTFNEWLFERIMPREDMLTNEDGYHGAMLSCAEMIKTGTTCFMDMHMFKNMTAAAADQTGMRVVLSRGLVGSDRSDEGGLRRLDDTLSEMKQWSINPRFGFMIAPHAIYTCGEDYLRYCTEKAKETGLGMHIHLSESPKEIKDCKKAHDGMTPVEYLESIGFFDVKTCAAHCVQCRESDIEILRKHDVNVIHNPKSNLKLANGIAPIPDMQKAGINICMGTDSQASNNSLNMFSEMNFAALIHKGANKDAQAVSARDVLRFATVNGAKALGLNAGEIAAGKLADIVLIDTERPEFYPRNDLISALVYSANGTEVDTVVIDGEIVLENGRLTLADEEEICANAQKITEKF
ncbi:MAG: amidohydrolase [Oscillospiraceae bacterium]|nr:amidohydrolase [Oscillospiraceae bacterium]